MSIAAARAERFPIWILPVEGAAGQAAYLTASLPFAENELRDVGRVRVVQGTRELDCSATTLNRWRNGSIRSALLECGPLQIPAAASEVYVEYGDQVPVRKADNLVDGTIDALDGGSISNSRLRLDFDRSGLKSIRDKGVDKGRLRWLVNLSGRGDSINGTLDSVPAVYSIVSRTARALTLRQEHHWGTRKNGIAPFIFALEYTIQAGSPDVAVKAIVWPTSVATRQTTRDYVCKRLAVEFVPSFRADRLELGTEEKLDVAPPHGEVFFSRTPLTDPARLPIQFLNARIQSDWQVVREGAPKVSGTGATRQYILARTGDQSATLVFKDFDAWGAWSYRDAGPNLAMQRTSWNAHFVARTDSIVAGILDLERLPVSIDANPQEFWGGQRWAWHLVLNFTGNSDPSAYSKAVSSPLPYRVPYERWVAAQYLPESEPLPSGLLDWVSVMANRAEPLRWPGGPDVTVFGHRPWYEALLQNWMRNGDPKLLQTFLRLTQQHEQFETCFDLYNENGFGASLDGRGFVRARGPRGASFYANPTPALLAYFMTGEKHFLEAHERVLRRLAMLATPEGFIHDVFPPMAKPDDFMGGYPAGHKYQSQGRAGSVAQFFFDADQLRQYTHKDDRTWFNLAARVYRYSADFAFSHKPGEEGFIYWFTQMDGRTAADGLRIDHELWSAPKPDSGMKESYSWLEYPWMAFHFFAVHSRYYLLTGDDEVLPYMGQFARTWVDPRSTLRYTKGQLAFREFHAELDAHNKTGGAVQAMNAARFTNDPEVLSIGKRLLAMALSPTHLWRYPKNPDIHPNKTPWLGHFTPSNRLPGSPKWTEEIERSLIAGSADVAERMGEALTVAVQMGNPFLFSHDLERYWYLDQGGKFAVVDDHSKPFDPLYYDKDNRFPDDQIINPYTERITSVTDVGSDATVIRMTADPDSTHHYRYWSSMKPDVAMKGGRILDVTYDPRSQTGEIVILHASEGSGELRLASSPDRRKPRVLQTWVRTGHEPYFTSDVADYREVLEKVINPSIDYKSMRRPHIRVLSDERTRLTVSYAKASEGRSAWRVLPASKLEFNHRVDLSDLGPGKWKLKIALQDQAGNSAVDQFCQREYALDLK